MEERFDLFVVGGGQAGLAAGYAAKQKGLTHAILEAGPAVGGSWQARYDSLTLFTPRSYSSLPGLPFPGEPNGCPHRDEVVAYLRRYAEQLELNVLLGQQVTSVTYDGETFTAITPSRRFTSSSLIVATGPFHTPRTPGWSTPVDGVVQLHSSEYRNAAQIRGERVLVVGGGNSGAQIAEELAAHFQVDISVKSPMRFMPATMLGRSLFWRLDKTGALTAPSGSVRARMLRRRGDPVIGTTLRTQIKRGAVRVRPETQSLRDGAVVFANGSTDRYDSIVYSTGFAGNFSWLNIPGALDESGQPAQRAGQSEHVAGLFYLGLGWLRSRNSALLGGAGADGAFVVEQAARRGERSGSEATTSSLEQPVKKR